MAWSTLIQKIKQLRAVSVISAGVAGLAIAGSLTGVYQTLEWSILDRWFQIRPVETKDSRIVVVEITESDIG
ncbi:MAG: CHASE2 domain-containing protein, partial [Pleurocapsa sp.]